MPKKIGNFISKYIVYINQGNELTKKIYTPKILKNPYIFPQERSLIPH